MITRHRWLYNTLEISATKPRIDEEQHSEILPVGCGGAQCQRYVAFYPIKSICDAQVVDCNNRQASKRTYRVPYMAEASIVSFSPSFHMDLSFYGMFESEYFLSILRRSVGIHAFSS